jgi:hypothetical protein
MIITKENGMAVSLMREYEDCVIRIRKRRIDNKTKNAWIYFSLF